jgi:integrase
VRVQFAPGLRVIETFRTPDEANARVLELKRMREAGLVPATAPLELTLQEACDALLARKRATVSRKTHRRLRERGVEWWERATRPWRAGPFAEVPLSLLRRDRLEDAILARAAAAAKTAGDELYGLKAALRYAGERGARFDAAILQIEPIARVRRRRHALASGELEYLARHAPDYGQRMLLFKGTVGSRIGELFTLVDRRVDLDASTIFIPAALCKEGVDKLIDLTGEERALVREQLLARPAGTDLVFPTKTGLPWRYPQFHRLVWAKAVTRAAAAWREEHGLAADASTPFEWQLVDERGGPLFDMEGKPVLDRLEPHDLRATAATLMRDAGFSHDQAAARLGHADSGDLLDRVYDVGDRRERAGVKRAIDELAPAGLRSVLRAPQPGERPTAGRARDGRVP